MLIEHAFRVSNRRRPPAGIPALLCLALLFAPARPSPAAAPTPNPMTAPYLRYSTYLGGSEDQAATGIAVDSASCAYITGETDSYDFPTVNPYQAGAVVKWPDDINAFVSKLSSSGSALIYSTYIGGYDEDYGCGIVLDDLKTARLVGYTNSADFPTRNGYQASRGGGFDAFVLRVSESGSSLLYATYFGGTADDAGLGIRLNAEGSAFIAGRTASFDFPTLAACQASLAGDFDSFAAKLDGSGSGLSYATFCGGYGYDSGEAIDITADGYEAVIVGSTRSADFPTENPYQPSFSGQTDSFVFHLSSAGSALLYSTYLGGAQGDEGSSVLVREDGSIVIAGDTVSVGFPTLNPYQASRAGNRDAFLTGIASSGSTVLFSTYLGGYYSEWYSSLGRGTAGAFYLTGVTGSHDFPTRNAYQATMAGGSYDAYASLLSSSGSDILFSTYLGGYDNTDYGRGIAQGGGGGFFVCGRTASRDFPILNAYQALIDENNSSCFVAKFGYTTPSPTPTPPGYRTPSPTPSRTPGTSPSPLHTPSPTPLPPDLALSATPVSGTAPLTVSFEAAVTGGSGIQYYRWDYNGDGVWDYISAYASKSSHTYSKAGTYQAICEVEDSLGRIARNSVYDIQVSPAGAALSVTASVDPEAGLAPLSATLSGDVSAVNPVLFYLWDFEYDGIVDSVSPTTPTVAHTYGEEGDFVARLSVIDSSGLMAADTVYLQVIPSFPPPTVTVEADPLAGEIPLPVNFAGSAEPSAEIVLYEWDFEGDGEYDWSSPTGAACSHTYTVVGTYEARLRATKANGMRGQNAVAISANAPSSLRAWISNPRDGWTVRGNAVTVRADTAPGYLTQWVQPQFKTETAVSWTDLTDAIHPPPYSFSCAWDTTLLPDGGYQIRARAADVSDGIVYSETVSVTVNNAASDPELDEGRDVSGNHERKQRADGTATSLLEIAGGTSLKVLYGALAAETTVTLSRLAANPHPAEGVLFAFTAAAVEAGSLTKPALLVVPYPDADDDGLVDGTGIDEKSLSILRYNPVPAAWQETPECTVSAEENLVQSWIMTVGDYALGPTFLRADRPVLGSGDYDGDGTSEIAVFRPGGGVWALRGVSRFSFGAAGDIPAPGDYDGDGTSDPALFRPPSGLWAIRLVSRYYFGGSSDLSVPADYDGDGRCDPTVFRGGSSLWAVRMVTRVFFGSADDACSPGDYNGDGTEEITVFRPETGLWAVRNLSRYFFGSDEDETVSGDYNGDGIREGGVFRYSSGLWAVRGITRFYLGSVSDFPLPAEYDGNGRDSPAIFRATTGLWSVRGLTRAFFGAMGDLPATR